MAAPIECVDVDTHVEHIALLLIHSTSVPAYDK